jgi:hypothetical protein
MLIRARCEKDINNLFNRYRDKCPSMRPPTSDDVEQVSLLLSGELAEIRAGICGSLEGFQK